jgi:hypothetical protein
MDKVQKPSSNTPTYSTLGGVTLREEHRLRVFENRVLGRIFDSKKDGIIS